VVTFPYYPTIFQLFVF